MQSSTRKILTRTDDYASFLYRVLTQTTHIIDFTQGLGPFYRSEILWILVAVRSSQPAPGFPPISTFDRIIFASTRPHDMNICGPVGTRGVNSRTGVVYLFLHLELKSPSIPYFLYSPVITRPTERRLDPRAKYKKRARVRFCVPCVRACVQRFQVTTPKTVWGRGIEFKVIPEPPFMFLQARCSDGRLGSAGAVSVLYFSSLM